MAMTKGSGARARGREARGQQVTVARGRGAVARSRRPRNRQWPGDKGNKNQGPGARVKSSGTREVRGPGAGQKGQGPATRAR